MTRTTKMISRVRWWTLWVPDTFGGKPWTKSDNENWSWNTQGADNLLRPQPRKTRKDAENVSDWWDAFSKSPVSQLLNDVPPIGIHLDFKSTQAKHAQQRLTNHALSVGNTLVPVRGRKSEQRNQCVSPNRAPT